MTAYISYARERIHPRLTTNASELLVQTYVSMRSAGFDPRTSEKRITATTRQLESMSVKSGCFCFLLANAICRIRLSEAHARMRFSDKVEEEDVQEAARLIREALKESATDPTTGLIDVRTHVFSYEGPAHQSSSSTFSILVKACSNARCVVTCARKFSTFWNLGILETAVCAGRMCHKLLKSKVAS